MNPMERKPIPLTEAEKESPVAKYYTEAITPPNPELMGKLLNGPMDPSLAITPNQVKTLLESGYVEGETGYCIMENGAGYLAVNNKFPGVTLDMIKWWFAWHPLESIRYKIWNPYCHPYVAIADVDRAKIQDPNLSVEEKIEDVIHFVVEDIGAGMDDIVIHFRPVEELGFTKEELAANHCYAIGGYGLSESREGRPGKSPAVMLHFFRETEDGIESRTRFWMGYRIIQGKTVCVLPPDIHIPEVAPMGLALHNVEDFGHLAKILPDLYAEFGSQQF